MAFGANVTLSGAITAVSPYGRATTQQLLTTTEAVPQILGFSPTTATVGEEITLTGLNFNTISQAAVGAVQASTGYTSDSSLTMTVPVGANSSPLTLTNQIGSAASTLSLTVVPTAITISSVSPTSGMGGTTATLTGTGFTGLTQAITFAGLALDGDAGGPLMELVSDTTLRLWVPQTAPLGAATFILNPGSAISQSFTVTAAVAPVISGIPGGTIQQGQYIEITDRTSSMYQPCRWVARPWIRNCSERSIHRR